MKAQEIAVIIQTEKGDVYQVILSKEAEDFLKFELPKFYPDGIIKVTNKLETIKIKN